MYICARVYESCMLIDSIMHDQNSKFTTACGMQSEDTRDTMRTVPVHEV